MTLSELEDRMRGLLRTEFEAIIFVHETRPVAYALTMEMSLADKTDCL